jgi:hypothetical protein
MMERPLHTYQSNHQKGCTGTGFFITDDGYLVSNYHVVKNATEVRLLTGAGLIDAKVVQMDAANDLALLKADGRFAPLPIAASRTGLLGGSWSSSFSLSGRGNTLKRELQRGCGGGAGGERGVAGGSCGRPPIELRDQVLVGRCCCTAGRAAARPYHR